MVATQTQLQQPPESLRVIQPIATVARSLTNGGVYRKEPVTSAAQFRVTGFSAGSKAVFSLGSGIFKRWSQILPLLLVIVCGSAGPAREVRALQDIRQLHVGTKLVSTPVNEI